MLTIKNLHVNIGTKTVLDDISIDFELWKNYAILWKNWSWKSSLSLTIMWHPKFNIINWYIKIDWKSIKLLDPNERSKKWIFLAFQNIPEIPWVKLFDFLKEIYNSHLHQTEKQVTFLWFKKILEPLLKDLWIPKEFIFRDLNVWFSWWEKRKVEILQMKLIKPKYIILDEVDSWLDINAIRTLWEMLSNIDNKENTFIIISHYFEILDFIKLDKVFILDNGKIISQWNKGIIKKLKEQWF